MHAKNAAARERIRPACGAETYTLPQRNPKRGMDLRRKQPNYPPG